MSDYKKRPKISFEQDRALARGRDVARSNQRRRVAANQAADQAAAEREYSDDYTTESRSCRECGATETRPVRL